MKHNKPKFQVGDECRIRQWDDMERELGVSPSSGTIRCEALFTPAMRSLCGKNFTIESVYQRPDGEYRYHSVEKTEYMGYDRPRYTISGDMLELIKNFNTASNEEIDLLMG